MIDEFHEWYGEVTQRQDEIHLLVKETKKGMLQYNLCKNSSAIRKNDYFESGYKFLKPGFKKRLHTENE